MQISTSVRKEAVLLGIYGLHKSISLKAMPLEGYGKLEILTASHQVST